LAGTWRPSWARGEDLAELLEGPEATGQRDESGGEVRHQGLAFVHAADDPQVVHVAVRDLGLYERLGDHPRDRAAGGAARAGDHPHEPDTRAPVDQADPTGREFAAERGGGIGIPSAGPDARSAEHAHPGELHCRTQPD